MTYVTQHNGGKTNINLNFFGDNSAWANPTINIVKMCQGWTLNNNWPAARLFDINYYPKAAMFSGGGTLTTINFVALQSVRPGNYVVKFDGKANISASLGLGGANASLDTTSTGGVNNRFVVSVGTTDDGSFRIGISAVGPDVAGMSALSNLRICHADDEALMDAGQIWSPVWINKLKLLNPGSIRFMNQQYTNTPNHSQFSTRKTFLASVWATGSVYPAMDFGLTSNVGADYSITTGRGALTHGETLHCQFNAPNPSTDQACTLTNANPMVVNCANHGRSIGEAIGFTGATTGSPNLNSSQPYYIISAGFTFGSFQVSRTKGGTPVSNVGDTASAGVKFTRAITFNRDGQGAVPMVDDYGGMCPAQEGALWNNTGAGGRITQSTLVYDAFCNVWFMSGNGRWDLGFEGDQYIKDCTMPLEAMLDLCAQIGAHPLFSAWVDGMYSSTGLHRDHATFCKNWIAANNVGWMKYRMEGPNEFWNYPKFGVYDTSRAIARNMIRQGINTIDLSNPYGWGMAEIGQEISGVFGGDTSKYDVIVAVNGNQPTSENAPRLNSDQWMAQGSAPSGYVLQPAKNFATSICMAQYVASGLQGNSTEVAMQNAYSGGDASQLGLYLDTYGNTQDQNFNIVHMYNVSIIFATWAFGLGIKKFTGYEGGYSPDYGTGDTTYTLRRDAKQYTKPSVVYKGGIYHLVQSLVDTFFSVGPASGMTMEFFAIFQFEGANPSNNAWSIQEDIWQPPSEQLKAYSLINNGKRRYIAIQS